MEPDELVHPDKESYRGVLMEALTQTRRPSMTQNRMTYQALLVQLQGADTGVLGRVLEHAMQRPIEAEAATQIGAQPHERGTEPAAARSSAMVCVV
jgi:hypothetical protein